MSSTNIIYPPNIKPMTSRKSSQDCNNMEELLYEITTKRIKNNVGVSSSLYTSAIATINIGGNDSNLPLLKYNYVNWNQSSDRNRPAIPPNKPPNIKNSLEDGLDIKFNSYNRYLGRYKSNLVLSVAKNYINSNQK